MPLTPDERKRKLGFGGLTRIAENTERTLGHVSQVNSETRRDAKVEQAITDEILRLHPDLTVADIWPATHAAQVGEADSEAHNRPLQRSA